MSAAEVSDPLRATRKIVVIGANGALGRALLTAIGPDRAIAVTRGHETPVAGFAHARLSQEGEIPASALSESIAVVNAAGRIRGTDEELMSANVALSTKWARQARDAGLSKFVQAGSFSVYGYATDIDRSTPLAPVTAYGRSKAAAEEALFGLEANGFALESIRLPFLFSEERPALLAPLIRLGRLLKMLPDGRPPVLRSMITYADAATVLIEAAIARKSGVRLAADPQLFGYVLLRRLALEECGQRWLRMPVPEVVVATTNLMIPALGRRLFRSSVLSAEANALGSRPMSLEATLRRILRNQVR